LPPLKNQTVSPSFCSCEVYLAGKVDSTPVIELDELKQLYNSTGMNIYTLLAFLKDKINMSLVRLL
jgi:hypothetical protein